MQQGLCITNLFVAAGLLPAVLAAPAPQIDYAENTGAVAGIDPPVATSSAVSGSLYGDSSLLGGVDTPSSATTGDSAVVSNYALVNGQEADADLGLYLDFNSVENPQPLRGSEGQTAPGPRTYEYEKLNPDLFAPPGTDSGSVPQLQWPLGLSHNRFGTGKAPGWARQQNTDQMPEATAFAGVNMRLAPHAYREMHWHTANEWSLMLKGSVRIAAVDEEGRNFLDDITAGDVWFFPAGVPHSIQALDEGCEFLLIFDEGDFSEDATSLVSELFQRNPKEVLSKNFQTPVSAFDNIPDGELYIFNGTPAPANISAQNQTGPAGIVSYNGTYSYHFSQQEPYRTPGGTVKLIDETTFPIAENFAAALVTIEPGAMREMHWHLTSDEWNYFIQGSARITVFQAPEASRTFDFTAGDIGYIPATNAHYIENTGSEDVILVEMLSQHKYTDISVAQWLAITPKQVVQDTLGLPDETIDNLPKTKTLLKPGNKNLTALASDPNGTAAYQTT